MEYKLTSEKREKLLRDMLVLLDGRWFVKTIQEYGFEAATKLNLAVAESIGKTEMKQLLAVGQFREIKTIEDFKTVMEVFAEVYWPDMQKYEIRIVDKNTLAIAFFECHVHKMTTAAGTKDIHQCAGNTKAKGWFKACGLDVEIKGEKNTNNCDGGCETFFTAQFS